MPDFEKLGVFYLGKEYDLRTAQAKPDLVLYDAKDLTTHAVCVGMTGSGKTGLCITLLEEAAIDGIPAIAIDPKGDLGNLLLTFPQLQGSDFRPWVDETEATRREMTPDELAAKTAERWKQGLAEWGQDGARIERLRAAADVAIYTPGSSAGLPLTVLRSFAAPAQATIDDTDTFRQHITASASGLLALLGIEADPIQSREHILLSNILERAWRAGQDLDLPELMQQIQSPPFEKVGFLDLETFFPAKKRTELLMRLNNVLASPAFAGWLEGEPLNIQRLLYTAEGKPRLSIISIAHLSDAERMFFVTILLGEVLAWVRSQPGTSSLRALLYMDEVFGYFPPTANPPSKLPMLTLLKQARAYGLGIVLATQNPVDLDYKGLSNAGTWLLGRLQTERDKARVLDGLEGASASAGTTFDRQRMESILSGLGNRVFLMNNVHEDQPVIFQTRWALSYLRGPMTRSQIHTLMAQRKEAEQEKAHEAALTEAREALLNVPTFEVDDLEPGDPAAVAEPHVAGASSDRPLVPAEANERFITGTESGFAPASPEYRPALLAETKLHFTDARTKIDHWQDVRLLAPLSNPVAADVWANSEQLQDPPELSDGPADGATFRSAPPEISAAKSFREWEKDLRSYLYRTYELELWKCKALKQVSSPGESEADFRIRLSQHAREQRDAEVEKLRAKYASRVSTLQDQIRRAEERVQREQSQYTGQTAQTAISFGATLLGALLGRKVASRTNVSGAASAMRGAGRAAQQRSDVTRAQENLDATRQKLLELEQKAELEIAEIQSHYEPEQLLLEPVALRPRKSDITIRSLHLAWMPS